MRDFQATRDRVNKACNFFADTFGVDYCGGVGAATITQLDAENRRDVRWFPELRAFGYRSF